MCMRIIITTHMYNTTRKDILYYRHTIVFVGNKTPYYNYIQYSPCILLHTQRYVIGKYKYWTLALNFRRALPFMHCSIVQLYWSLYPVPLTFFDPDRVIDLKFLALLSRNNGHSSLPFSSFMLLSPSFSRAWQWRAIAAGVRLVSHRQLETSKFTRLCPVALVIQ